MADANYYASPASALENAMVKTNKQMHQHETDDSLSGTTAVSILMKVRAGWRRVGTCDMRLWIGRAGSC